MHGPSDILPRINSVADLASTTTSHHASACLRLCSWHGQSNTAQPNTRLSHIGLRHAMPRLACQHVYAAVRSIAALGYPKSRTP